MTRRLRPQVKLVIRASVAYAGIMSVLGFPIKTYAETPKVAHAVVSVSKTGTIDQDALKKQIVAGSTAKENGIAPDTVDSKNSVALVMPNGDGTAKVSVYPAVKDKNGNVSLNAKPITGQAFLKSEKQTKPTLELTSDQVTINNGDSFNEEAFIAQASTPDGKLPALDVQGNVNTAKDGDYMVTYKAVDSSGVTTTKTLKVTVKTPDEVIEARKRAAEEKARQEAAAKAKAEAEAKAQAEAQQKAQQAAAAAAQAQAQAQQQQSSSIGIGNGSATGQAIVATAKSLLGSPYVHGGSSPAGFDCSGFTQYVFGLNGIGLNRTAASQAANGVRIDASQAQAGDLMLWTGHAAIYEGNGYVIHAMNPALGVRESAVGSVYGSGSFLGFYRINGVN